MIEKQKWIWMDGELVEWERAQIHVLTYSLHHGHAVLEGMRCYRTDAGRSAIFRLDDHVRRLLESARILGIRAPWSAGVIKEACRTIVSANGLAEAYLRPLIFVGEGDMTLYAPNNPVRLAIIAWPWGPYLGADAHSKGVRVKVASFSRNSINAWMSKAKTNGSYVNSILAKTEAKEHGYDEAVFLDAQGYVAEGTGENIFIVRKNELITTPIPTILEGITRDTVLTLARLRGLTVVERLFTRDELYIADEAFFTGTAAEITPIREVDGRQVGTGEPGAIVRGLQQDFRRVVAGEAFPQLGWLTHV